MMENSQFPARAWPDMCAAYREPALSQACLALQEDHAVDVPLLLVLALADRAGYGIEKARVAELARDAAAWRETVIVPLRQTRQAMKPLSVAPSELALREDIKRVELAAEHIHVQRIIEALPGPTAQTDAAGQYLASRGVPVVAAADFIEAFSAACAAQISGHEQ